MEKYQEILHSNDLQTLQVYKKVDKPSAQTRVRRMFNELEDIKKNYIHVLDKVPAIEREIQVKNIGFQNTMIRLEKEMKFWVNDYRELIDEVRELERKLPKNDHQSEESDRKAQENVQKIITVESIRDQCLAELKTIFLQHEESETTSRRTIRRLENELWENQMRLDELEFQVKRLSKRRESLNF